MSLLINGFTIAGACLLIVSLIPIQRLIGKLAGSKVRRNWYVLRALIFFFIAGYIVYAATKWNNSFELLEMIVPAIFFLGACFVLLVNLLSLQTARDIRRLAVLELENIMDPVMDIYNRRYLDRRLKQEVERALRYDLSLSVLLLDIDHFKRVNDQHGHQIGDLVLSRLGKLVESTARNTDIVARYGGEEIMVIATNTPFPAVLVLAERLRKGTEDAILMPLGELNGEEAIRVTVSIGVAILGPAASDVSTLVKCADDALYRAKDEGRNRVIVHCGQPSPS